VWGKTHQEFESLTLRFIIFTYKTMMMHKCWGHNKSAGLLILRIGVGGIFIMTGWMKFADLPGTVGFFGTIGFAPFWAYLVTAIELLGGIAVLIGIFTRIASGLLAIVMAVAIYKTLATPQFLIGPISLLFSTLALKLTGAGKYALMRGGCGRSHGASEHGSCAHGSCGGCSGAGEHTHGAGETCSHGEASPHTH